jgi:uncharacterized SAM-binding protein YcdF (DUF218 family)
MHQEQLQLRVARAVELFKEKKAPKIIFSGGLTSNNRISEAAYMKKIAMAMGVPPSKIILEEESKSTIENAYFTNKILRKRKFTSAILVTTNYHMARASYIFGKQTTLTELETSSSHSNYSFFQNLKHYIKEYLYLATLRMGTY